MERNPLNNTQLENGHNPSQSYGAIQSLEESHTTDASIDHVTSTNCTRSAWFKGICLFLVLVVLSIAAVVFIGIACFGSSKTRFNTIALVADILLIITYISSAICICIIACNGGGSSHHSSNHNSSHSSICITIILILGFGDGLFNLTRFGDRFILILNQNYYPHSCVYGIFTSMMENLLKCIYHLCVLMFIMYQFKNPTKAKSGWSKIFIVCLSMVFLVQWVLILFQEIDQEEGGHDSCIVNISHGGDSFHKIEPFLYPLGVEFRFACFIELLIISKCDWKDVKKLLLKCCNRPTQIELLIEQRDRPRSLTGSSSQTTKKCGNLPSIFYPASGLFLVSASMVIIFFQEFNESYDENVIILISEICEIILVLIISFHTISSCILLRKLHRNTTDNRRTRSLQHEFKIDFFFLLIANIFIMAYCALALTGSSFYLPTDRLTKAIWILTIIASIVPIFQTILQSYIIWNIYKQPELNKVDEVDIDMWMILSFAIWLFDTFSAKKFNRNQIQRTTYGKKTWQILGANITPMAIFYRFHSCIVFANIKAGVYGHKKVH